VRESCANRRELFACVVQEEGRTSPPTIGPLRLSRILRGSGSPSDPAALPTRRTLLWLLFGAVVVVGLVLYFKYERLVVPLLT
jgi:hypothetical protein